MKHSTLIKRVIASSGILCTAAVLTLPPMTVQGETELEHNGLAGICYALHEMYSQPTITSNSKDIVAAPNVYEATYDFKDSVSDFKDWCLASPQLRTDYVHTIYKGDDVSTVLSINSQTDNESLDSHVVAHKDNYDIDMWYNIANQDYYVNMNNCGWSHIDGAAADQYQSFFDSHIIYKSSYQTLQKVFDYILEQKTYDVSSGVLDDAYNITFESTETPIADLVPTFGTSKLQKWGVVIQKVNNVFYADIVFVYDNAIADKEVFSYVFDATDNCNIDKLSATVSATNDISNFVTEYNNIRGGE